MAGTSDERCNMSSAFVVQTATSYPSNRCLQWSGDGQLCYITKGAIYIFTPEPGINFDTDSVVKSALRIETDPISWFKTIISADQAVSLKWPEYSQDWAATSLGSIDGYCFHSAAISPSGLSSRGRCIVATLTTNMDVVLWAPGKHYLKGEWFQAFDITPWLLDLFLNDDSERGLTASVLLAQTVAIEWTPQIDFGLSPAPRSDGSMLVLGNRGGCIIFLRYQNDGPPQLLRSISVSENWITHLSFSTWSVSHPGECEGYLAYGTSKGAVGLIKITQALTTTPNPSTFIPDSSVTATFEHATRLVHEPNKAGITSMRWIGVPNRSPILVWSHPGFLKFFSASTNEIPTDVSNAQPCWTGLVALRVPPLSISFDSSPFNAVVGYHYNRNADALLVASFDGAFRMVYNLSTAPSWDGCPDEALFSTSISAVARSVFSRIEKQVDSKDMQMISGMQGYDDEATTMWVYESLRPSDFSYKHDAKHSGTIVVSQLSNPQTDEQFLDSLTKCLSSLIALHSACPLSILRPYFLYLRIPERINRMMEVLLNMLEREHEEDESLLPIEVPAWKGEVTSAMRLSFRQSLANHLFGWNRPFKYRVKLSLADFSWKLAESDERRAACGVVAQRLQGLVWRHILLVLLKHLSAVSICLEQSDIPFLQRIIPQANLPTAPSEIRSLGEFLSGNVEHLLSTAPVLEDTCPACAVPIPFENATTATCANKHVWARCSVTTFVLSVPWVRTCVGCNRKAFLPPSADERPLPNHARGWVVTELLEAVDCCLFCGNGFVSIL